MPRQRTAPFLDGAESFKKVTRAGALGLLAGCLVMFMVILSLAAPAHAQSSSAGQALMGAGTRVPFALQAEAPALTPEQQQLREDAMKRANRPGPPLPEAPAARSAAPSEPSTDGQLAPPGDSAAGLQGPPGAPSTFTFFRNKARKPFSTGTSTIAETQAGTAGAVVFMTGNWFASYSNDGGKNFSFVNPYTQFPSLDGGFCCDQTAIYSKPWNLMIWQLQYIYSATTMKGSYRTAFATPSGATSGGWCYYDWSPQSFGLAAGLWLDYPHVALSKNFVWYTANVYNPSDSWQRTLIWRIPLSPVTTCGGFTYNYFVVSDRFNFTPTQNAGTTMYWGSHNSTASIRIYRWGETSGTIFWDDVAITTWPRNLPYQCAGPDGLNWCGRGPNDGRIETGWVAKGVIGFMWNASQGSGFTYPYIHVARFSASTRALINEPIIWHPSFAWQYPAIGVNGRGDIAGPAYWGGGSFYPTMVILIWDGFSSPPPPWENYGVVTSGKGASAWGDWYSSRRHGSKVNTWIATGEAVLATGTVQARYVWFGREQDAP
jgi:hypothetical protein